MAKLKKLEEKIDGRVSTFTLDSFFWLSAVCFTLDIAQDLLRAADQYCSGPQAALRACHCSAELPNKVVCDY